MSEAPGGSGYKLPANTPDMQSESEDEAEKEASSEGELPPSNSTPPAEAKIVASAGQPMNQAPDDENHSPESSQITQAPSIYTFHDAAIQSSVERYLNIGADELTAEDLEQLTRLQAFAFDVYGANVTSLRDLPELFPNLTYIRLAYSWFDEARLSMEDCRILEEMPFLRAVDIYSGGLPSLDFTRRLPYVSLRYTEGTYLSDDNNLADASVLGKDFIEKNMNGNVREYVKVADGERVYELIVADHVQLDSEFSTARFEAKVFVSERRNDAYYFLDSYSIQGRLGNISGGLVITDANFDGEKDILVSQGHFGAQGLVTFACYLGNNGTYELNESFSTIMNPSLDVQNHKVLSTWRNMAVSHSWAMYSYIDGEFVETERLTQEPETTGEMREDGSGVEIEVWKHIVEHFGNGNTESETYLTSDYSDDEWRAMFYRGESYWGLLSDKWRTLYNQGTLMDWSIYGGGLEADAQIIEIISN